MGRRYLILRPLDEGRKGKVHLFTKLLHLSFEPFNCPLLGKHSIEQFLESSFLVHGAELQFGKPIFHVESFLLDIGTPQGARTILPKVLASITAWWAVAASARGSSRFTTGRRVLLASPAAKAACMPASSFSVAL
jgi:hypothetical protein